VRSALNFIDDGAIKPLNEPDWIAARDIARGFLVKRQEGIPSAASFSASAVLPD